MRLEGSNGEEKRYWIARNRPGNRVHGDDTDIVALRNNYVSITPLRLGMGDDAGTPQVDALLEGLMD